MGFSDSMETSDVIDTRTVIMRSFITGTQVYGPITEKSDIDIVVFEEDADAIAKYLSEHNIEITYTDINGGEHYKGFYFNIVGLRFNIVVVTNEEDWNARKTVTDIMKQQFYIPDRQDSINMYKKLLPE